MSSKLCEFIFSETKFTPIFVVENCQNCKNKLAKLRRHASRVHFAKITLDRYTLENTLKRIHFGKINFGGIHFDEIHFGKIYLRADMGR